MESDQRSITGNCELETGICEIAVRRVDVIQDKVLNRKCNDLAGRNVGRQDPFLFIFTGKNG